MNQKNLIGKTLEQQKSMYEVDLIAEYEMEWGELDHWSDEVVKEFDEKWDKIQKKFKDEKERIEELQEKLHKIKISPETIAKAREISRECGKISVEKLFRPFDI